MVVSSLEGRLADNQRKLAGALAAVSTTMHQFKIGLEHRLVYRTCACNAAMQQLMTVLNEGVGGPSSPPALGMAQIGQAVPGLGKMGGERTRAVVAAQPAAGSQQG